MSAMWTASLAGPATLVAPGLARHLHPQNRTAKSFALAIVGADTCCAGCAREPMTGAAS